MSLIDVARRWTFRSSRKSTPWKQHSIIAIIKVSLRFTVIPSKDESCYHVFCLTELLLYHPFHNIENDFGINKDKIITKYESFQSYYHPWHTCQTSAEPIKESDATSPSPQHMHFQDNDQSEWQVLSSIHPSHTT